MTRRFHLIASMPLAAYATMQANPRNGFLGKARCKFGAMANPTVLLGTQLATSWHLVKTRSCLVRR